MAGYNWKFRNTRKKQQPIICHARIPEIQRESARVRGGAALPACHRIHNNDVRPLPIVPHFFFFSSFSEHRFRGLHRHRYSGFGG